MRRLRPRAPTIPPEDAVVRTGLFVDTETTGLDPTFDEIIELAMVPLTYGGDDEIFPVGRPFQALRKPSRLISPEITAITGITNDMVAGATIKVCRWKPSSRRQLLSPLTMQGSTGVSWSGYRRYSPQSLGRAQWSR